MEHFYFAKHASPCKLDKETIEKSRMRMGKLLMFACFFMYATSMATKGVFAAESKFIKELFVIEDYSLVSMTNTFYFVAYGLIQVLLFFIIKRINLRKYMILTIPFAAISMILMGTADNIYTMWLFFGLTGAFQAGIFCGCTYLLTENLPTKLLTPANKIMNLGYALGTLVSYGLCGLCVGHDLWRLPYYLLGGLFLISVFVFAVIASQAARYKRINERLDAHAVGNTASETIKSFEEKPLFTIETKKKVAVFYALDIVMSFFGTCLFYMVMNYITSLLVDVHGLTDDVSIYVSMLAPAMIAIGPVIAIGMCDKKRDFVRIGLYWLIALLPVSLSLAFLYDGSLVVALLLSLLFVVIANGCKAVTLSVMAFRMRKQLNSGAYSAMTNAVASLAAGIAPTVAGAIIDDYGWQANYLAVTALTVALIVTTLVIDVCVRRGYAKKYGTYNE